MTLVQTRQKLQPFLDDGVVYKDRKIVKKVEDESKRRDADLEERIVKYREQIAGFIENRRYMELEMILNELTLSQIDDIDSLKIYEELRMSIVHGQICLAAFFKWKRDVKEKQVQLANQNFKNALIEDAKKEARRAALKAF